MWIPTTHNRHRYSKACGGVKELPGAFRSLCSSLAQPKFLVTLKSSGSGEKHLRWKEEGGRDTSWLCSFMGSASAQSPLLGSVLSLLVPVKGKVNQSVCISHTLQGVGSLVACTLERIVLA